MGGLFPLCRNILINEEYIAYGKGEGKNLNKRILTVSSTVLFSIALVGCSSQPSPGKLAQSFVDAIQSGNWNDVQSYEQNPSKSSQPNGVALEVLKKDSFKVGSASVNGNTATVDVQVTAPDMAQIMKTMLGTALANALTGNSQGNSDSAMTKELETELSSKSLAMTTSDVKLNMVKTDSGWKVSSNNDDFLSAITGHIDQLKSASNSNNNTSTPASKSNSTSASTNSSDIWTYYNNAQWSGNYNGLKMQIEKVVVSDKGPHVENGQVVSGKYDSYVGIKFKMTNTTQKTMTAYPDQARLVTSTGEQIDTPDLMGTDNIGGEIEGGVTKEGNIVWLLQRGHAADIKWVRVEWDVHLGTEDQISASPQHMSVTLKLK
jgi:hypothetical protein